MGLKYPRTHLLTHPQRVLHLQGPEAMELAGTELGRAHSSLTNPHTRTQKDRCSTGAVNRPGTCTFLNTIPRTCTVRSYGGQTPQVATGDDEESGGDWHATLPLGLLKRAPLLLYILVPCSAQHCVGYGASSRPLLG